MRIGLPRWLSGKESACQCRRLGFNPWVRKIPWRRKWQPTPVFLPRKPHGPLHGKFLHWKSHGAWRATVHGLRESDMTEQLNNKTDETDVDDNKYIY